MKRIIWGVIIGIILCYILLIPLNVAGILLTRYFLRNFPKFTTQIPPFGFQLILFLPFYISGIITFLLIGIIMGIIIKQKAYWYSGSFSFIFNLVGAIIGAIKIVEFNFFIFAISNLILNTICGIIGGYLGERINLKPAERRRL